MKEYNLTLDNCSRSPFHWGICPIKNIHNPKCYGIYISTGELMPTSFKKRWVIIIYFYKWFKHWSNYKLNLK